MKTFFRITKDIIRRGREKRFLSVWKKKVTAIGAEKVLGVKVTFIRHIKNKSNHDTLLISDNKDRWILRVGNADDATVSQMKRWIAASEKAFSVGVRVPKIIAFNLDLPAPEGKIWMTQEYIRGYDLSSDKIDRATRVAILKDMGRQLRLLHTVEVSGFGALSSDLSSGEFATYEGWLDWYSENIKSAARTAGIEKEAFPIITETHDMLKNSYGDGARLCHADCFIDNMLVEDYCRAVFIDWDKPIGSDPAYDAGVWYERERDPEYMNALLTGYNPSDPENFRRRAIAHAVRRAIFGIFLCWQKWWHEEEGRDGLRKKLNKALSLYRQN